MQAPPPPPADPVRDTEAAPRLEATPIAIAGIPFDPVDTPAAVAWIETMILSRRPHYAVTANVDFVVQALEDPELRRIIFDAHLVLCDGMPLVWASRLLGNPLPERVAGSDLVPRLLERAATLGWGVYLLGASPESLARAAERSLARHPGLRIVGTHSPPFAPLAEMDHAGLVARVREARPDLLLVAFGCPKQEKWINLHYRHLGVPMCIGVGATLDFLAGTVRRAPRWMQRIGLEWLHRLLQEPRRLAGRYARGLRVFGGALLSQSREMRRASRLPRTSPATQTAPPPPPAAIAGHGAPPHQSSPPTPPSARDESPAGPAAPARLAAPERLDAAAARTLEQAWIQQFQSAPATDIDLGGAAFVDSTGIGLLVRLRKLAGASGRRLRLLRPQAQLRQTFRLMRIEAFFEIVDEPGLEPRGPVAASKPADAPRPAAVLVWSGELTRATRDTFQAGADRALAASTPGDPLVIDLAGVTFLDSSGVSLLAAVKREAWRLEVEVSFRDPSTAVLELLRRSRLDEYLLRRAGSAPTPMAGTGTGAGT